MKTCHPQWKIIPSPVCMWQRIYNGFWFLWKLPGNKCSSTRYNPRPTQQAHISSADDQFYAYWLCDRSRKSAPVINQPGAIQKGPLGNPSVAALNSLRKVSPYNIVYTNAIFSLGRIWSNLEGQSIFFPYLLIKPHSIYIEAWNKWGQSMTEPT